jgi:hypothetical protein
MAYAASLKDKSFVIVDGNEGKSYSSVVNWGGGKIAFKISNSLHYIAIQKRSFFLVEEKIK